MRKSKTPETASRCGWLARTLASSVLVCSAFGGCIVGRDRCGDNEMPSTSKQAVCVCVPGTVPDPRGYGCTACGEHEAAIGAVCECEPGYERKSASSPCTMSEGGALGAVCDDATPCTEPYPYCASSAAGSFCTSQGCASSANCPSTWRCNKSGATSFCAKPPTGLEQTCQTSADCSATESTFCDTFFSQKCYVEKCATGDNACPNGYSCCDLQAVVATSVCAPTGTLQDGKCPDGKPPVSP